MKRTMLLILLSFAAVSSRGVEPGHPDDAPLYVFHSYGTDFTYPELDDYPVHILGDTIARKLVAVKNLYIIRREVTIGFTDSSQEITKPAIYKSVNKIDSYLKKAVARNEIDRGEAIRIMGKCLDVAYVSYYSDTSDMESRLRESKKAPELIGIFESVVLSD